MLSGDSSRFLGDDFLIHKRIRSVILTLCFSLQVSTPNNGAERYKRVCLAMRILEAYYYNILKGIYVVLESSDCPGSKDRVFL